MDTTTIKFLVIGAGVCGASTALELARQEHGKIVLVHGLQEYSASQEYSKVVRKQYRDKMMSDLAPQSIFHWEHDDLYAPYYKKCGWVRIDTCDESEANGMCDEGDEPLTEREYNDLYGLSAAPLNQGNARRDETLWMNRTVGMIDPARAVNAVIQDAVRRGVHVEQASVSRIIVESGICQGVELTDGRHVFAENTFLAVGAWTPSILEASNIALPSGVSANFFRPTSVAVLMVDLNNREYEMLKSAPIIVTPEGEIMPPTDRSRSLKVTSVQTADIVTPDDLTRDSNGIDVSSNRRVLRRMMPAMLENPSWNWRCCDVILPRQWPLVDEMRTVEKLNVITGGSYHLAKFLPILGRLAVNLYNGKIDQYLQCMRWERDDQIALHEAVVPSNRTNLSR